MFVFFPFFITSIVGGWSTADVSGEQVNFVRPFLDRNIKVLFPDITNGIYEISSAKIQIVAGFNLKMTIKAPQGGLVFTITLYVNPQQKVSITSIERAIGTRPILGGYKWQNVEHFSGDQLQQLIRLIRATTNTLIGAEKALPLVYRTHIENGLKSHVIFKDSNNAVFSAVYYQPANGDREQLISVNLIQ